jgi:hypothetical protein
LFASSACADTANTASSDTIGRTILDRLDTLILEKPLLAVLPAPIGRTAAPKRSKPTPAPKDDAANIADRLIAPCLVTNP